MKQVFPWLAILSASLGGSACSTNQKIEQKKPDVLIFSYFTGNGEDGLHLAYSEDGLKWKALNGGKSVLTPTAGRDKLMRDPCICQGPDGTFHMVWTVSWKERGIGYASSKDLIHWSTQRYIPVMRHEPDAKNCWAPEVFYDDVQDDYMIFWATTIPGRFPQTDGQKEMNHRIYGARTKDFEWFTPTELFYDQGFNVIDSTIVKVKKGRYAMFLKDETFTPFPIQKNIRVAYSEFAGGPYGKPSAPITGDYWAEGPAAIELTPYWYVYFDKYKEGKYGVIRSKDLETWEDVSAELEVPQGIRHGTVFGVSRKILEGLLVMDAGK